MIDVERLADLLALDEDLHLSILEDGVVDLFAFLGPHVTHILRRDFGGVEDVIAQHRMDERASQMHSLWLLRSGWRRLAGGSLRRVRSASRWALHDVHL